MKVYKYSELSEANLSLLDLSKPGKDGKLRGDILVSKIENEEEITVNPKSSGDKADIIVLNKDIVDSITDDNGNYDTSKGEAFFKKGNRYSSVIHSDDNQYKLNDIEKTPDFGNKLGSKKRSDSTRIYETLACLFLSFRQKKESNIKPTDIDFMLNSKNFSYYMRNVISRVHVDTKILKEFWNEWGNTFIKTSNSLYNRNTIVSKVKRSNFCLYGTERGKIYNFYQISSFSMSKKKYNVCKEIFNAYDRCIKAEVKNGLPFPPNLAKWNPSDIWAANCIMEQEICESLKKCMNMDDLNNCINRFFRLRDLVGISLKKVIGNDINIIINHLTDPPIYKFNSVKVSEKSLNTISVDVVADVSSFAFGDKKLEYMTVRSFDSSRGSDISGEVKGISAQQGKISLTQINKILYNYGVETVPTIKTSSKYNPDDYEPLSDLTDEELEKEIDLINNLVVSRYGNITSGSKDKTISRGRLYSKYQALYLAWILSDITDKRLLDKIISDMFYYALSIKFDGIRTPMYVRVID